MKTDLEMQADLEEEVIRLFAELPAPAPPISWEAPVTRRVSPEVPDRTRRGGWLRHLPGQIRRPWLHAPPRLGQGLAEPDAPYTAAATSPTDRAGVSGHGDGYLGMRPRSTRVAISAAVALVVAAGTFAALGVSLSQRGHSLATVPPLGSGSASPSLSASAGPPISPSACLLPVSQKMGTASTGVTGEHYGFLDTASGELRIDTAAPTQPVGVAPGFADQYVPSLGGWRSLPDGAVISPDGRSYAYLKVAQSPFPSPGSTSPLVPIYGGQVHVVSTAGTDRTVTPGGELDDLIGWATDGIVIARANQSNGLPERAYLINPSNGMERVLAIAPGSLSLNDVVAGDTLWYWPESTPGEPQTVVGYNIRSGASTTWVDTQGTPYSTVSLETVDAQGHPVVWVQNSDATSGALLVLTTPNDLSAAQTAWSGPLQQQGYSVRVTDVRSGSGWLWFVVETYRALTSAGQTPADTVLDAASAKPAPLQASGRGHLAMPLGAGPLTSGSTLGLYWWTAASGAHRVARLPATGENSISIVGACIPG